MAILGVGSSLCWLVVVKPFVTIEFAGYLLGKLAPWLWFLVFLKSLL